MCQLNYTKNHILKFANKLVANHEYRGISKDVIIDIIKVYRENFTMKALGLFLDVTDTSDYTDLEFTLYTYKISRPESFIKLLLGHDGTLLKLSVIGSNFITVYQLR